MKFMQDCVLNSVIHGKFDILQLALNFMPWLKRRRDLFFNEKSLNQNSAVFNIQQKLSFFPTTNFCLL